MFQFVVENAVQIVATTAAVAGFVWVNLEAAGRALGARTAAEWEAADAALAERRKTEPVHGKMLCVKAYDARGAAQQLDCFTYSTNDTMLQYRSFLSMKIREGAYAGYRSPQVAIVKY